jgi:hypothetical protein
LTIHGIVPYPQNVFLPPPLHLFEQQSLSEVQDAESTAQLAIGAVVGARTGEREGGEVGVEVGAGTAVGAGAVVGDRAKAEDGAGGVVGASGVIGFEVVVKCCGHIGPSNQVTESPLFTYIEFLFYNVFFNKYMKTDIMVEGYSGQIERRVFAGQLLNFSNDIISEEACKNLCKVLEEQRKNEGYKEGKRVQSLYLYECSLTDVCSEYICAYLESDQCELKYLDVSKNLGMSGLSYRRFGDALSANTSLEYICLWRWMHPRDFDAIQEKHGSRVIDMKVAYPYKFRIGAPFRRRFFREHLSRARLSVEMDGPERF